ncbi:hypothetical protein, partial [Pseudomonas viridiflava]|uniref:hypothetical protein n=1 Tax=Pseudomonas viridiflava TaxID=33069 RepID=UPI00197D2188
MHSDQIFGETIQKVKGRLNVPKHRSQWSPLSGKGEGDLITNNFGSKRDTVCDLCPDDLDIIEHIVISQYIHQSKRQTVLVAR